MSVHNLTSLGGMAALIGFAWLLSSNRGRMNWRLIGWGVLFQAVFALLIFRVPFGASIFIFLNDAVVRLLESAAAGTGFVFGRLALSPGMTGPEGEGSSLGFILAFQALPTIVFFSALVSILYYYRVIPMIVRGFARVFTRLMRISGAESLCAASNIFVGVESSLTVRPYLPEMTRSELCTVLTAGMATVASNVLAMYVFMLSGVFPSIAGHLISASVLSAPAALVMSKIILPEDGSPVTLGIEAKPFHQREDSLFEAIIGGANAGVRLIVGIVALLLAVLGLVALVDMLLGWMGGYLNDLLGLRFEWSLESLLGYLFYPFTLALGVPPEDATVVARIIGERTVATEVAGYQSLAAALSEGLLSHPRSAAIATYALCGFAHVASLAIFVGGTSAIAPSRAKDLARVGPRALLAATLACLMTACVAGLFLGDDPTILGLGAG